MGRGSWIVTDMHFPQDSALPVDDELRLDRMCDEFEQAWRSGSPPQIEQYIDKQSLDTSRVLLVELIRLDLFYRMRVSQSVSADDYVGRFPELDTSLLQDLVETAEADAKLAGEATYRSSSAPTVAVSVLELRPDMTVGPYRLLDHIGEGGMGSVFRAQQTSPVERQVALKVVKPGLESRQFVARFEAERQALALMDHPNIAKVFDAGTTDDGRPYFVMELVQGVSITSYCDENNLPIRQRLELFLAICHAVQHAHQKGIIHRDLKPSNVLVAVYDGKPMPKVIDFGVVKITGATLTERTTFTGWGTLVGTLQYMSPEQAELDQLDTDTRCDVYSLSVLLYELLTGATPLGRNRLKDHGLLEVLRIIRDEDPPKPSARIKTLDNANIVSRNRRSDPKRLGNSLRGELDWIVMKGLEKNRDRRYQTAYELGSDVQRYLQDEQVQACPPSARYRFSKFARRNKAVLTTASLVFAALLLGTALSTWQAFRASRAQNEAFIQLNRARKAEETANENATHALESEADTQAFASFLVENVLIASRPEGVQGGMGIDTTVLQALEYAEENLDKVFQGRPRAEMIARHSIGVTWRHLTKYEAAERHLRRAIELANELCGPISLESLKSRNSLGVLLNSMGREEEAIQELEEVLRLRTDLFGSDDPQTLATMGNLAMAHRYAGHLLEAEQLCEKVVKAYTKTQGVHAPHTLAAMQSLGAVYHEQGRVNESMQLLEETMRLANEKLGTDHRTSLATRIVLAKIYQTAGRHADSVALLENTVELLKQKDGPDHLSTAEASGLLSFAYRGCNRMDEAAELLTETLRIQRIKLGPTHDSTLVSLRELARLHRDAGRPDEALPMIEEVLAILRERKGDDHPETLQTMNALAATYWSTGQLDRSIPLFEEVLSVHETQFERDHPNTLTIMLNLATNYRDAGRFDDAIPLFSETLQRFEAKLGVKHPMTLLTQQNYAVALARQQRWHEAEPLFVAAIKGQRARLAGGSPKLAVPLAQLGECLVALEKFGEAEATLREGLAICQRAHPDTWFLYMTESLLGASLLGQKKHAEAEPFLIQGYKGLMTWETDSLPAYKKNRQTEALAQIVLLYQDWNKPEEAAKWQHAKRAGENELDGGNLP
jgi:serine/threonine protein kinase